MAPARRAQANRAVRRRRVRDITELQELKLRIEELDLVLKTPRLHSHKKRVGADRHVRLNLVHSGRARYNDRYGFVNRTCALPRLVCVKQSYTLRGSNLHHEAMNTIPNAQIFVCCPPSITAATEAVAAIMSKYGT